MHRAERARPRDQLAHHFYTINYEALAKREDKTTLMSLRRG